MSTTDIERHTASTTVPAREWALMSAQANELAKSDIVPEAYRRKPANVIMAAMTGRHFGWDVVTAMNNGHVIEGKWGMKPEAMLGLVRQAGHSVSAEHGEDRCTVTGTRSDTGDTMSFTFTLGDAVRAGLCQIKDGKPWARSKSGKPLNWETYPQMMMYWRAAGFVCRMLFSDVTLGVHTVDELGAPINADGEVDDDDDDDLVDVGAIAQVLSVSALGQFRKACAQHSISPDEVMARAFPDGVPDPLTDEHLPTMRDAFHAMVAEKQEGDDDDIADAEVVEPDLPPKADVRPASRKTVGAIKGHYARVGIPDRDLQLLYTIDVLKLGADFKSHNELDADEAALLLDHLSALPDQAD